MHRDAPLALALALALALVLPSVALAAPPGAATVASAEGTLSHWVGPDVSTVDANLTDGENASLWLEFAAADANLTWNATVSPAFEAQSAEGIEFDAPANLSFQTIGGTGGIQIALPASERSDVDVVVSYNATVTLTSGNATVVLFAVGEYVVAASAEAPVVPPAGLPQWVWIGLGVGLLGVLVAGILFGQQRARRRAMNEGPKRSQVMRELELEQKLQKAKDPEQVQEIKQEIRQQEQVREKRRELQILEAKRADALKTLELLRKRHEAGGLTKLQYDNMVAKKQGDLQKIEADIAQMESEDAGGAAAS